MRQRVYGVTGILHSFRVDKVCLQCKLTATLAIYRQSWRHGYPSVDRATTDTKVEIKGIDLSQDQAGTEPKKGGDRCFTHEHWKAVDSGQPFQERDHRV